MKTAWDIGVTSRCLDGGAIFRLQKLLDSLAGQLLDFCNSHHLPPSSMVVNWSTASTRILRTASTALPWSRIPQGSAHSLTYTRSFSSSSRTARKMPVHHLMIGTWTPPGAIFTVAFDDEKLTLELVKRTEIPQDEPISWMAFDVSRASLRK